MFSKKSVIVCAAVAALVGLGHAAHAATWSSFTIRDNGTEPATITGATDGSSVTASITEGGDKVGYGTSFFDGQQLSTVKKVTYTRVDAGTKFPYVNIWVTDGTNHAIVAPEIGVTYTPNGGGYDTANVVGQDLQSLGFSVWENSKGNDYTWIKAGAVLLNAGTAVLLNSDHSVITLADIGNLTVEDPNSLMPSPWTGGTGAPKGGTGFNLVFGDTQGNYTSPIPYHLTSVNVVPEPSSLGLVGLAGLALLARRRRRIA